jgi:prophage DNA circulation protein
MMRLMNAKFEMAKSMAADEHESGVYEQLVDVAARLIRYLADLGRPLPRYVHYDVPPMPALTLSQFVYGDGSRWEELVDENKIPHPLFCPNRVRALSA